MSVLWMCSGLAYYFFFSFEPSAPNYSLPYNFYDSKICFFVLSRAWDQEDIVFSRGLRIFFSVPFSRQDKKSILLFFYRPRKLQRYLSFKSRVQIPYTPEFFSGLIIIIFYYCDDHFHSRLYPQFKYMTFRYS